MSTIIAEDFRARLVGHAQVAIDRAGRATTEAATSQYLVLPFLQMLGYDPLNPDEVVPEAHASFSEKFKNRVDYAICQDQKPVIAVECKRVGTLGEGHRGELKGYFNAVPTVKLGILTDGLIFQLFTDTGAENMMDDQPFAMIDLRDAAQDQVDATALDALQRLRKGTFDPANVGADARRKMLLATYVEILNRNLCVAPEERFVRMVMDVAGVDGRRTTKLIEEHAQITLDAAAQLLDRKILERVGFAERNDLVRMKPDQIQIPAIVAAPAAERDSTAAESGVVTTETEQLVWDYVRTRLPFLIERDEAKFGALAHVRCVDHKTVFCVYYKQERKGKLFDFRETVGSPRLRFAFVAPEGAPAVNTDSIADIDAALLAAFSARVAELGT